MIRHLNHMTRWTYICEVPPLKSYDPLISLMVQLGVDFLCSSYVQDLQSKANSSLPNKSFKKREQKTEESYPF
ncbi:hypothetical protein HanIR_Chr16g0840891 [Helianthus annuus]|nr:hypothetical protein HanIR_Chr16g0840891 [Helianthus annuus]